MGRLRGLVAVMKAYVPGGLHWPLPPLAIASVLLLGVALLVAAIVVRRKSVLCVALVWNTAIVIAFMSPFNRHVFHLATHRTSVVVNALAGVAWLSLSTFAVIHWFHRDPVR